MVKVLKNDSPNLVSTLYSPSIRLQRGEQLRLIVVKKLSRINYGKSV